MSATAEQRLVRETMLAAGGYWRPLAAVARLLEELGELSELLFSGADGLAAELADLWIITTALADQFLAEVEEPGHGSEAMVDLGTLLAAAGPIARVVNHYDGPKVPRAGEPMPTLQGSIAGFHMVLSAFAATHQIDLTVAVREKIDHIHLRGDIERFGRQRFDPSTASVLDGELPAALPERLWGAPGPELAARGLPMFAKAALPERLEGFVIAAPPLDAGDEWLSELAAELDPAGRPERFVLCGQALVARAVEGTGGELVLVSPV